MVTSVDGEVFPNLAIHPGELLGEELEARELTVDAFAAEIDRPAATIRAVIQGTAPITADLAVAFEHGFQIAARFWMNLQIRYDLTIAYHAAEEHRRIAI